MKNLIPFEDEIVTAGDDEQEIEGPD